MVLQTMPISDKRINQIKRETANNSDMPTLRDIILTGWPQNKHECPRGTAPYWNIRQELSVADGLILKGSKLIISLSLRKDVLTKIHQGHLGIEKCRKRSRDILYWPGLNGDIDEMVKSCSTCQVFKPKQPSEPLQPHDIPIHPWQKVGTDLFTYANMDYLIVTDYYSLYPEVISLISTSSKAVITSLKSIFARHGTADIVVSDNGPCYSSIEFEEFSKDWDFIHTTSSPHFPQSNGLVESSVKAVKALIQKAIHSNQDIFKALQAYRATTVLDNKSPAQLLMGRRIKTSLPIHPSLLNITESDEIVQHKLSVKQKQKDYHDQTPQELPPLHVGDRVRLLDYKSNKWLQEGNVLEEVAPRSYQVQADNGANLRRNRKDLRTVPSLKL